MRVTLFSSAITAALSISAPAMADQFNDCCESCRRQRDREMLSCESVQPNQKQSCVQRIAEVERQCLTRCAKREQERQFIETRRAKEKAEWERLRALQNRPKR